MRGVLCAAGLAIGAALAAAPAGAIQQCKAAIDKKTGEVVVSAKGVVGTPRWSGGGVEVGDVQNGFPDLVDCGGQGKLKKCHLAAPGSERARRPTATCTLHVEDDTESCTVRIAGCVASSTMWATVRNYAQGLDLYHGFGAVSVDTSGGTGVTDVVFERRVQWCAAIATIRANAGQISTNVAGNAVTVLTFDHNGVSADREFDLVVHCP
jgi:hypothetical protein